MDPLPGEGDPLAEEPAGGGVVALGQLHEMDAALQAAVQQHLDFQGGTPHVHGTVNHEGAVGHKQDRRAGNGGLHHQVQEPLHRPLHPLVTAELPVLDVGDVDPAEDGPPEAGVH